MTEEEVLKVLVNYGLLKVIRPKIQNRITDRSVSYVNTLTFDNIRGDATSNSSIASTVKPQEGGTATNNSYFPSGWN